MVFCFSFFSEILLSSLDFPLPLSSMYLYPAENMIIEELDQLCKLSWKKHSAGHLDANTEVLNTLKIKQVYFRHIFRSKV